MTSPPSEYSVSLFEEIISMKWNLQILRTLLAGPARFSRIKQSVPDVSAKVLAARLAFLEGARVVERVTLPDPQNCQVYQLTDAGSGCGVVFNAIADWAQNAAAA